MKLMIVDDERAVHEAVRLLADAQRLQIEQITSAYSAEEALKRVEHDTPDMMLVDMKMPHVDGVSLMHAVREKKKSILFIVISGYDLFEYTRSAIQLNALDYLLKPLDSEELNAALEKAAFILRRQHEQHEQMDYYQTVLKPMERDQLLRESLISASRSSAFEMDLLPERLRDDRLHRCLCVCFPLNGAAVCETLFENDNKCMRMAICDMLNESVNAWGYGYALCAEAKLMNFALFIALPSECADPESYVREHLHEDFLRIHERFGLQLIAQLGRLQRGSFDTTHEYQYLCSRLDDRNLVGVTAYSLGTDNDQMVHALDSGFYEKKILLERCFQQKDLASAMNMVDDFFGEVENGGVFSRKIADWILSVWMMELKNLQSKYDFVILSPGKTYMEAELRRSGYALPVLQHIIRLAVRDAMQAYTQASSDSSGYAMLIRQYIEEYYFCEINLTLLSSQFHISKNHLSKIFKSEYGMGIYEYYLEVRMKHAAEMLEDPTIKIRFIAERLCFSDSNYFSKAFKHYYGVSPSEYRRSKLG